ncbi:hypothetical protein ADK60_16530 [Streptomyces sp. XY431]|nr:hypothetical protein ADK60_16530 [Streptomyces sp. XY431]
MVAASSALADLLPVVSVDRPLLVARLLELGRPRPRLELSQEAWTVLAQAGGTVAALYRHLRATVPVGSTMPSLPTVHRMVKRVRWAGYRCRA